MNKSLLSFFSVVAGLVALMCFVVHGSSNQIDLLTMLSRLGASNVQFYDHFIELGDNCGAYFNRIIQDFNNLKNALDSIFNTGFSFGELLTAFNSLFRVIVLSISTPFYLMFFIIQYGFQLVIDVIQLVIVIFNFIFNPSVK